MDDHRKGDEVMVMRIKAQPLARPTDQAHGYRTDHQRSGPVPGHR
ncbi:hypothetical protein AAGW05_11025 [Arthrobacter sp. LAPM80]